MDRLVLSGSAITSLPQGNFFPVSALVSVSAGDGSPAEIGPSAFACFLYTISATSPPTLTSVKPDSVQPYSGIANAAGYYGITLRVPFADALHKYALGITASQFGIDVESTLKSIHAVTIAQGQVVIPLQSTIG